MILSDREITDIAEIEEIINQAVVCHLGMVEGNKPYVVPMNFAYINKTVYLHSAPDGKKVDVIKQNNNVCITFDIDHAIKFRHEQVACSWSMRYRSVVIHGKVDFIDNYDEKIQILNLVMKKYAPNREFKYNAPAVNNVLVWEIKVDEIFGKKFM